jgi:hypothetical protein
MSAVGVVLLSVTAGLFFICGVAAVVYYSNPNKSKTLYQQLLEKP